MMMAVTVTTTSRCISLEVLLNIVYLSLSLDAQFLIMIIQMFVVFFIRKVQVHNSNSYISFMGKKFP